MPEDIFKRRTQRVCTTYSSVDTRFQLVAKLLSTPEAFDGALRSYAKLEELVHKDFLCLTGETGIPGESRLYNELLVLLKDLRDLVEFPHLANKSIVAIGGGFSSGKSRFINSLIGGVNLLPTGISPTTAIPTYVTIGNDETIRALNVFNRSESLNREDLRLISHAFDEKSATAGGHISLCHILKLVQVRTPAFPWKNIAVLDTPGYSKPRSGNEVAEMITEAGNTDEEKAREHLSQADHLIWAIPAANGTIRQNDIEFLRDKVLWDKPIYLLVTKCDQSLDAALKKQIAQIRADFSSNFHLVGWSAYSAKRGEVLSGDDPRQWFAEIDGKIKYTQWHGRFKAVIDKVIRFNADEERRYATLESSLRPVFVKGDDVLKGKEITAIKDSMVEIRNERKSHARATKQFASFGTKMEQQLCNILKELGITDETVSDVGLVATMQMPDTGCKLRNGDTVGGCVETFSRWDGCFLSVEGFPEQARIKMSELKRRYSAPGKTFAEGTNVDLCVYEVNYDSRRIVFTAVPARRGESFITDAIHKKGQ